MERGLVSVTHLFNAACNFVTPPYSKVLQFYDPHLALHLLTFGTVSRVDYFGLHRTHMVIGFDM